MNNDTKKEVEQLDTLTIEVVGPNGGRIDEINNFPADVLDSLLTIGNLSTKVKVRFAMPSYIWRNRSMALNALGSSGGVLVALVVSMDTM